MIYYITPNGCGTGTTGDPCSILYAAERMQSGDTLYIASGTYHLSRTIEFRAAGDKDTEIIGDLDRPILDFSSAAYDVDGVRFIGNNLHCSNLIICNSGRKGVLCVSTNSLYENIECFGHCDSGFQLKFGGGNVIKNCDSHDNFGYKTGDLYSGFINFGFHSDGFSDKLYEGPANTFIGCRAWNNTDDGFDFFGRICTEGNTKLINCYSFCNGRSLFDMTKSPRFEKDKAWFAQFNRESVYIDRRGVPYTVTITRYPAFGNGNGFKLGGNKTLHNVSIENCIAVGNKGKGFDQNNNTGLMQFENCFGHKNKSHDFGFSLKLGGEAILKNCIANKNRVEIKLPKYDLINCNFKSKQSIDIQQLMQKRKDNGELPDIQMIYDPA